MFSLLLSLLAQREAEEGGQRAERGREGGSGEGWRGRTVEGKWATDHEQNSWNKKKVHFFLFGTKRMDTLSHSK